MVFILAFTFVILFAVVVMAAMAGFKFLEQKRKRAIANLLKDEGAKTEAAQDVTVLDSGSENAFLTESPAAKKTLALIQQAGLEWTFPQVLVGSAVGAGVGFLAGGMIPILVFPLLSRFGLAALFAAVPWMIISMKRKKRLAEIERQFPESLDFLARSMRAGHAFTISLEMLGQETPDPLGQEIRTLYNEQNLGAPLDVALGNLVERVPLLDVRFFVSTVLLQKRTGGNLSEILIRLAHVIRERFQIKGQVKAVSAHGRITAAVLSAIPIVMAALLTATSPDYLKTFAQDPAGKWLLIGVIFAQICGYFVIRKIVNIKV